MKKKKQIEPITVTVKKVVRIQFSSFQGREKATNNAA